MINMKLETAKGVRDFPPEEKIIREKVVNTLKTVFEKYGFNPFEQPIIEKLDVLTAKFGAGESSDVYKEIFKLTDQGERKLGLRFELTLGLCRYIAMNPKIKLPFKRYEIGRVYRDGPIKLGRYREFWQCDVDIVGTGSMIADAEIIGILAEAFEKLEFDVEIEVSNRKLLDGMLEQAGVKESLRKKAMISIDKLKKIGIKGVAQELEESKISNDSISKLKELLAIKGSNLEKLSQLDKAINNEIGKQGLKELKEIFEYTKAIGTKNIIFNQTLARGLAYYTGPVFEVFLKNSKITSSVAGGGRYDEFIGNFLGGKKQIPATGVAFGLEPITEAIKLKQKDIPKSVAQVYVIPIKVKKQALEIVQTLRKAEIKADFDLMDRGLSSNLDYANKMGIPYVIIVGQKDLDNKQVTVRNMKTGKEEKIALDKLTTIKFN